MKGLKNSHVLASFAAIACFYDVRLIHFLIHEITQFGIITVYKQFQGLSKSRILYDVATLS